MTGNRFRGRGFFWNAMVAVVFLGSITAVPARAADTQSAKSAIDTVQRKSDSVWLGIAGGTLRVMPCAENMARITYAPGSSIPEVANPALVKEGCTPAAFDLRELPASVNVVTPHLTVSIQRSSGAVQFLNAHGEVLLKESERPFPRKFSAINTDGQATHRASVWFALTPLERLYGVGQHQTGILDNRNLQFELSQDNTNISIPFFLSSKGYGVFWNSPTVTDWNNRFQPVLAIHSDFANAIDYFFMYGPQFDKIIASYRTLTGQAPLFGEWAYGFWQSKDSYKSQQELLAVGARYRELGIPLDNLVLDSGWETVMGSRIFNQHFPNPRAMVQTLHDEHVHLMVSIWPLFQPPSANFNELESKGLLMHGGIHELPPYLPGSHLYDALSSEARKIYWNQAKKGLFDIGVDGFWMDSTEVGDFFSEAHGSLIAGVKTGMGNGSAWANIYPLMTTMGIYQGQRSTTDAKRVFILSRSGFAGMQRNAAAAWSGDTATNFETLRREIPAGLNYSMTGLPYWTTDIGGYLGGDTNDPAYREVFVRWFQYGSFCPIFRVHGHRMNNQNELWAYGRQAQTILTLYDRLRYRLMPYTYALAARTTFESYTPMRALAFDFRKDGKALDISDEFLYGPSILVAPVTEAGATARNVYLPAGTTWYDFWTGQSHAGGTNVNRAAPLSVLPLYVRAGSILPLGPEVQYASERLGAPIELRIYRGADGDFKLYGDDGTTYDYEKGQYCWTAMHWNDKQKLLSFDSRQGSFPGMPTKREFHIVLVGSRHGVGEAAGTKPDKTITYDGSAQQVRF